MLTYGTGCLVVFLWSTYWLVIHVMNIYGVAGANMRHIGMHYNLWTGQYKRECSKNPGWVHWLTWFLSAFAFSIPFSWVAVAWRFISLLVERTKNSGIPEAMRKFRWHVHNVPMSQVQMIQLTMQTEGVTKDQKRNGILQALGEGNLDEFDEVVDAKSWSVKDDALRATMRVCEIKPNDLKKIRHDLVAAEEE